MRSGDERRVPLPCDIETVPLPATQGSSVVTQYEPAPADRADVRLLSPQSSHVEGKFVAHKTSVSGGSLKPTTSSIVRTPSLFDFPETSEVVGSARFRRSKRAEPTTSGEINKGKVVRNLWITPDYPKSYPQIWNSVAKGGVRTTWYRYDNYSIGPHSHIAGRFGVRSEPTVHRPAKNLSGVLLLNYARFPSGTGHGCTPRRWGPGGGVRPNCSRFGRRRATIIP